MLCMGIAKFYLIKHPNQYEATMQLIIGKIGADGSSINLEKTEDLVERISSTDFIGRVLQSLGWDVNKHALLFRSSFQVIGRENGRLDIRLRGFTSQDARRAAETTLIIIQQEHAGIMELEVAKLEQRLAKTMVQIGEEEATLEQFKEMGGNIVSTDSLARLFCIKFIQQTKINLHNLRRLEANERKMLDHAFRRQTKLSQPVSVTANPIYPKAHRIWGLALVTGLLLGVLMVTVRLLAEEKPELPAKFDPSDTFKEHQVT